MKAMLEARMVAASTQRPLDFDHGAVAARDRITFSSQGSRNSAHIFAAYHHRKESHKSTRHDWPDPATARREPVRLAVHQFNRVTPVYVWNVDVCVWGL